MDNRLLDYKLSRFCSLPQNAIEGATVANEDHLIINAELTQDEDGKTKVTFITAPNTFWGYTLRYILKLSGSERNIKDAFVQHAKEKYGETADFTAADPHVATILAEVHNIRELDTVDRLFSPTSLSSELKLDDLDRFIQIEKKCEAKWNAKLSHLRSVIDHSTQPLYRKDIHYKNQLAARVRYYEESTSRAVLYPKIIEKIVQDPLFQPTEDSPTSEHPTSLDEKTLLKIENAERALLHLIERYQNLIEESQLIQPTDTAKWTEKHNDAVEKKNWWLENIFKAHKTYISVETKKFLAQVSPLTHEPDINVPRAIPLAEPESIALPKLEVLRVLDSHPDFSPLAEGRIPEAIELHDHHAVTLLPGFGPHLEGDEIHLTKPSASQSLP